MTGLARLLRGYAKPAWRTWRSGMGGTSSHSGAERVILPDATIGLDYMHHVITQGRFGLVVHVDRLPGEPRADQRRDVQPAG